MTIKPDTDYERDGIAYWAKNNDNGDELEIDSNLPIHNADKALVHTWALACFSVRAFKSLPRLRINGKVAMQHTRDVIRVCNALSVTNILLCVVNRAGASLRCFEKLSLAVNAQGEVGSKLT